MRPAFFRKHYLNICSRNCLLSKMSWPIFWVFLSFLHGGSVVRHSSKKPQELSGMIKGNGAETHSETQLCLLIHSSNSTSAAAPCDKNSNAALPWENLPLWVTVKYTGHLGLGLGKAWSWALYRRSGQVEVTGADFYLALGCFLVFRLV